MQVTAARDDQVRENRLRRIAERQGRTLTKSRHRDPLAEGFGTYNLSASYWADGNDGLSLDEVESHLVGQAASQALAEYDELNELLHRLDPDCDATIGPRWSVVVHPGGIDEADYFMQEYLRATADEDLPIDYSVDLNFDNRRQLVNWLRTVAKPTNYFPLKK